MSLKIFYISSEVDPFSNSYILSKIARKIAIKFQDNPDLEIRLLHPKYGFISERKYILREVIRLRDFPVTFENKEKLVSIKSAFIPESRAQIYFLEDEKYFKPVPELLYKSRNGRLFKDNDEKFLLFSKVALETLKQLLWKPDLIICNDWQTSFIPQIFKNEYSQEPFFEKTKIVFNLFSINQNRFYEKKSLSKVNISVDTNSKKIDSILNALKFADKTICFDQDGELLKKIKEETPIYNQLNKSNHNFIKIPKSPKFSDWREVVSSFHKNLVEF